MNNTTYSLQQPKAGFPGLIENWRHDILAGFQIFLIALPLCLGIAMASNFPPMAGITAAMVGGLLVSRINGSFVTISGPAAGLIVVTLSAVESLGGGDPMQGYRFTLAAIVVAGLLQLVLGIMKVGKLSAFFPSSVVHGMLAAIGVIIMAKQFHTMLGVTPESKEILETIAEIPSSLLNLNPEVALIGASSLLLLIFWPKVRVPYLQAIPAPITVVLAGMALGQIFDLDHTHKYLIHFQGDHQYEVGPAFLVAIPENFIDGFYFPDFSKMSSLAFWVAVISICLVSSLESLLSATAIDKLDPYQRQSDLNKDLRGLGIGSSVSGLLGGLPMISEIVRSSANVDNGARTGWSNFFHGVFMLTFVALFPRLIHEIPLASLAALLVYTGYRLASPQEFAKTLGIGIEQLALFLLTIIAVLATDLLIGVAIGIVAKVLIHLMHGVSLSNLFKSFYEIEELGSDGYAINIHGAVVFSNFISLKSDLASLPKNKRLVFDMSDADFIDHTVMEFVHEFMTEYNNHGGSCGIKGLEGHQPYSDHPLAARKRVDSSPVDQMLNENFFIVTQTDEETIRINVNGSTLTTHLLEQLEAKTANLPAGKTLIFDYTNAYFLDRSAMEFVKTFSEKYIKEGGVCTIEVDGNLQQPIESTGSGNAIQQKSTTGEVRG